MDNLDGLLNLSNLASGRLLDPLSSSRRTTRLRSGAMDAPRTALYRAGDTGLNCGRMK
jgi:hypothetical protein